MDTEFFIYRLTNKASASGFSFLAAPKNSLVLMSLSEDCFQIDSEMDAEAEDWLKNDYSETGQKLSLDIEPAFDLVNKIYHHDDFNVVVRFDNSKTVAALEFAFGAADNYFEIELRSSGRHNEKHAAQPRTSTPSPCASEQILFKEFAAVSQLIYNSVFLGIQNEPK